MTFTNILRIIRPLWLAAGILLYTLGSGVARFLGARNGNEVFWPGLGITVLLLASAFTLKEYFDLNEKSQPGSPAERRDMLQFRSLMLAIAGASLTVAASLALAIINEIGLYPQAALILVLALLCSVAYATPPLRLAANGYGELTMTLLISIIFPALGFVLLYDDMHRFLPMVTFPLAALQLAMQLTFGLPGYAQDIKYARRSLLLRMGWERGVLMHNILVPLAFLLLTVAIFFDLPFIIGGPALLALPFGALQLLLMRQITAGAKPNWRILTFNAAAMFSLTAYLLAFGFWTH